MKSIPELLAPAGGMRQLKAAVENGADAVYLGGNLFNARIHADNFNRELMAEAVAYAHLRNVKVYVTMNILVKTSELEEAANYARELYELGVDALIVQDLGLARLLRRRLPEMRLHLSTQGTVYNLSGVRMAKRLGFQRAVLAREVTLEEIKDITREQMLEIEVFVHGALCICYSGQCQMSRILGGRSGNRGLCAQPCRLGFTSVKSRIDQEKEEGSHLLSPKDLCAIDYLDQLAEAGVDSLKIEGRMKSAEYIAVVTGIYRKYLDEYRENGCYQVSEEDRQKLEQVFNRGGFTTGYLEGNPGDSLMWPELPKHQGVFVGRVLGSAGRSLIDIQLERDLAMGDGIEIRNPHMPGNVLSYLKDLGDGKVRVGDIRGPVKPGDKVYKITDKKLMEDARESFEDASSHRMQQYKKIPVNAVFRAEIDRYPQLELREGALSVQVTGKVKVEKALKRSIGEEDIKKQLSKTGDMPFKLGELKCHLEEGLALSASAINELRREAFQLLMTEKVRGRCLNPQQQELFSEQDVVCPEKPEEACSVIFLAGQLQAEAGGLQVELYFHTLDQLRLETIQQAEEQLRQVGLVPAGWRVYVPLYEYAAERQRQGTEGDLSIRLANIRQGYELEVTPYLPCVTKGAWDDYVRANFESLVLLCQDSGIAMGNLGWISEFQQAGVPVYGDYGLNIFNEEAAAWCREMGLADFIPSHETYKSWEGSNAERWTDTFAGDIPLMVSEHLFSQEPFIDRKNQAFAFAEDALGSKSMLLRKEGLSITEELQRGCGKKLRIYYK
ncbi:U32 family peptidase [Aminipila butyrica]|uniref:U32 family peptidase n=1 Tax=Aminipila butyrica TaxID=433296 RepID=A0A858C123_9FIRM|nr:U32 family peptidase [Aminipila butyrica]QIB70126.1 U32 family peptidase [Aminipila butyrica]